jgi:hypothetical protein
MVTPIPKPPFVVLNTVSFPVGKPDKVLVVFDMGAGFFGVAYRISTGRVDLIPVRRRDLLDGKYQYAADSPKIFAAALRDLAIRKGVSYEAYLTLGQMKPFNREEEILMAKLSRKADPEPEVEEDEDEAPPAKKTKAKAAPPPPPAKAKKRAAAPEPEEDEDEVDEDEEVDEEAEEEEVDEDEEEEAPVAAKARSKAKAPAPQGRAKAAAPAAAKGKPAKVIARDKKPAPRGRPASNGDNDTRRIKILKKPHGAREGTFRAGMLDDIYASRTVQEAVDAGVKKSDVAWAARSAYIELI